MSVSRVSVRAEPSFAELGIRVRLSLARALTEAATSWIDDPGLSEEAGSAAHGPAWCVLSARARMNAHRLRGILPDSLSLHMFVSEAFRVVLGRSPDANGLMHYVDVLRHDPAGRGHVLETLAGSAEARRAGETFQFHRREDPAASC
jgi:hypothetical protein